MNRGKRLVYRDRLPLGGGFCYNIFMESKDLNFHGKIVRNITFTATTFREGKTYVAYSPELDLSSCGDTREEAKINLLEAARGFIVTASEQGTLEQILEEAGLVQNDKQSIAPPEAPVTDVLSMQI